MLSFNEKLLSQGEQTTPQPERVEDFDDFALYEEDAIRVHDGLNQKFCSKRML